MDREDAGAKLAQSFAYEIRKDSAVIWRCFSRDTRAEIPETLGGFPVRELMPYAFSAHMEEAELRRKIETGNVVLYRPQAAAGELFTDVPALCGNQLEEISLPPAMRRVGRYCFYDCKNLVRVEFHGMLTDWGSGVFTRCHQVRELRVWADEQGGSYLKDVLDELPETLEVEYIIQGQRAKLMFPEFYEEGVENTPARILETHVHGSGISYRNCFQGRRFDFAQYDTLFPYAKALESEEVVARMVTGRLRYPEGLTPRARKQYEDYVAEHDIALGKWMMEQKDLEGLQWLLNLREQEAKLVDELVVCASKQHDAEAVSYLMNCRRVSGHGHGARRRMEL